MTVLLLAAAALAATASIVAIGCVAYIMISFWRSGPLMAARVGQPRLALVRISARGRRGVHLQRSASRSTNRAPGPAWAD